MPTDFTVTDEADLQSAIDAIDIGGGSSAANTSYHITFAPGLGSTDPLTLDASLHAIDLASGDSLTIDGREGVLDGASTYRGFFVYSGRVTISNLTIQNAVAHGGTGVHDGGSGAGLGGGLFVANGSNVLLVDDTLDANQALGGSSIGANAGPTAGAAGGGIGLTGNGFGTTGTSGTQGTGIGTGALPTSGGPGGTGGPGGAGGAGGAGYAGIVPGLGGGGGPGGMGGFGGGGGAGGYGGGAGGAGGFGGGGGGGGSYTQGGNGGSGGAGGFGGGGGGGGAYFNSSTSGGGAGGFGGGAGSAGTGTNLVDVGAPGIGGGGLGAGGGIFVQQGGILTIEGGTVSGNAVEGGTGAATGAAFGAGLFFQGDNSLRLGATAGQLSEIDDVIADQSGSGGTGAETGQINLTVIGTGTLKLGGANTYSGGTTVDSGTLELNSLSASGSATTITFAGGADATLQVDAGALADNGTFSKSIVGFDSTDKIDLRGLSFAAGATAAYDPFAQAIEVTSDGITDTVLLSGYTGPTTFTAVQDAGGGTEAIVCFATGTLIRTVTGNVPVEALKVGNLVATKSGMHRPIRWLGHRKIDCRRHSRPHDAHPIRVAANAFGRGRPARDLFLSPGHPVLVGADQDGTGGYLVPIRCLINGTTIERVAVDAVTYWHVELDSHDILLAEGLPAESYIDWGDRDFFTEGSDHALQNPDFVVPGLAGRCRPVAIGGPVVEAERRRLDVVFAMQLAAACAWPSAEDALFAD